MNEEQLRTLPESVRDWDEAKNSETPEVFWDRISNMRSKFGTGVFKPGEDAGAEDWGKFTNKVIELSGERLIPRPDLEDEAQRSALLKTLGRPDDPTGYEFAEIEGGDLPDERKAFVAELAFKAGLTKSQLKIMDETMRTADVESRNSAIQAQMDAIKNLNQEWGLAAPDRINQAKKVAKIFFPHLGDDPSLSAAELKSFYSIGKQLGASSQEFRDQGDQGSMVMTPADAATKIAEIRGNKEHPYYHAQAPGHAAAKRQMHDLYRVKNNLPPE
jgi:hypothetical protein